MHRWLVLLTVVTLAGLVLSGTSPPAAAQAPTTLTQGLGEEPENIDPQRTNRFHSLIVLSYIVEPLFTLDREFKVVPLLAQSYTWSPDRKTLRVVLKDGITFHNGAPLTSADVKATFERYITVSPLSSYVRPRNGGIVGMDTPDSRTIIFRFGQPKPLAMISDLADAHTGILPASFIASTPSADIGIRALIGTGPYIFKEWVPGDRIVLERNDRYRHGPVFSPNRGPAHFQRMVFRIIPEDATMTAEVTAGNVDITFDVTPSGLQQLRANPNVVVMQAPTYSVQYLVLNMERWMFQNARVRQAIAHSIDKEAIARAAWLGVGRPVDGLINEATIGYWPGVKQYAYKYDVARAKALLAEAGWRPGADGILRRDGDRFEVTLITFSNIDQWRRAGVIVQSQLKQVGIEVKVETAEVGATYDRARAGNFDIGIFRNTWWLAQPYLTFLTHSVNIPSSNFSRWPNPELDKALDTASNALDDGERERALQRAQRIIVESAVWVPLVSNTNLLAAKKSVGGLDVLAQHPWWPVHLRALALTRK
ncbi:MAG: ABC transporter substrate-binding protein [Armatimonadota bacterium]|nr:ABC transporter substrate-binding protein [Armatimonadota bacterium]MDR7452450.1 ABC transporter substrate-binding protein [Armatimonadota bacterium]MDR7466188.1 ABC transporter substrate-binding protein [Armatimonadota bacterium]MDR7495129.1 ABC transporter substrate-binding protein [Armatimonadota bacterium]MDR7505801.1 ABC transporter substrate-binding protein [Armatimonadota bacterium]